MFPFSSYYCSRRYVNRDVVTNLRAEKRYIKTDIISDAVAERITSRGAIFASIEDASEAALRIAVDKSVCSSYAPVPFSQCSLQDMQLVSAY